MSITSNIITIKQPELLKAQLTYWQSLLSEEGQSALGLIKQDSMPLMPLAPLVALVEGVGLSCPLPLLKAKIALRDMNCGECLYVVASDPNAKTDLQAYARQSGHGLLWATTSGASAGLTANMSAEQANHQGNQIGAANDTAESTVSMTGMTQRAARVDTIFHFIFTKNIDNVVS